MSGRTVIAALCVATLAACSEPESAAPPTACVPSCCAKTPPDCRSWHYSGERRAHVEAIRERLLRAVELAPGMSVADIGAGGGGLSFPAARAVGPSGLVVATDIDGRRVAELRAAASKHGTANLEARLVTPRQTGLDQQPPGSLAAIYVINSVNFERGDAEGDVRYLEALRERLAPAGKLVYHIDWLDRRFLNLFELFTRARRAGFSERVELFALEPWLPARSCFCSEGGAAADVWRGYAAIFTR